MVLEQQVRSGERSLKILLVDDDEVIRLVHGDFLRSEGHAVTTAADGVQALRWLEKETFDLVITDIIMPNQDGVGLTMEIRKSWPDQRIIAMSGGGRIGPTDYLKLATRLGAKAVLSKPFDVSELLDAIDQATK